MSKPFGLSAPVASGILRRQNKNCLSTKVALWVLGFWVSATALISAAPEPARSADAFIDTIGVCTHWGYPDTPYGFAYDEVKQRLVESGIRHVRDGVSKRIKELGALGIHTTVVAEPDRGTPAQIKERVKAINVAMPGAIDAVEGPNEPDLFWKQFKKSYAGHGHAQCPAGIVQGVLAFQKELYAVFTADPATAPIKIIGPSLGVTTSPTFRPARREPFPIPSQSNSLCQTKC